MDDAFDRSLREPETPDGPFRTAEPTTDARLERARHESWERVARATRAALEDEARRRRRWDRVVWAVLGLSVVAFGALIAVLTLTPVRLGALFCPALAAVIASVLGVLYRRRLGRRAARQPE